MNEPSAQLTLPMAQHALHRLDTFDPGANGELVARLGDLAHGGGLPGLWIWGAPGSGRSHLLQGACHAASSRGGRVRYLPLASLPPDPEVLDGIEADLVALDDVDVWLGSRELETALMGLYQVQHEARQPLLVSAGSSAGRCDYALPDLGSRLRSLPGMEVLPPDDAGLRRILTVRARLQGLTLTAGVLDYWLHRAPRVLPVLLEQLTRLDARALAEQRRITVPLIKEVLGL